MLRKTRVARGGNGVPVEWLYTKPETRKRSGFPFSTQTPKHPNFAPNPGGLWASKYVLSMPFVPWELHFYRVPVAVTICAILYDLNFGIYIPFMREQVPNKPRHHWGGNSAGTPHHFWCYQDGWYVPNESGATRYVE